MPEPAALPNVCLSVHDVHKTLTTRGGGVRRTHVKAVDGVSLELREGQTLAVVGESGSGKTTLGRIVAGLLAADAGEVVLGTEQSYRHRPTRSARRYVQMVFQNPLRSFSPTLSIGSTLLDAIKLRDGLPRAERRAELGRRLGEVGLDTSFLERRPSEMSGGQLQRVGVVRALAPEPRVVVLDEPTSALDSSLHGQIVNLLVDVQRATRVSYLLISHDLRVARAMADHVIVLYLGQVVEHGPSADVLTAPLHPYTRAMLDAVPQVGDHPTSNVGPVRLSGEVVRPGPGDEGCKLRFRCPFADRGCDRPQELTLVAGNRHVRCWRTGEMNDLISA